MKEEDSIVVSKLWRITAISLVFMALELLGGYYAHSIAIFADAFHLLSDVSAYAISLYAVHKSYQKSPSYLTFGYEKVQPLGALLNVAIIWVVTAELFIQATHRIFHNAVVEQPLVMFATSVFGLLCNLYIMKVLHSDEHGGHHGCSHGHHHDSKEHIELEESHQHDCQHQHDHLASKGEDHHHCQHSHGEHQHNHAHAEHQHHDHHQCKHDHSHHPLQSEIIEDHSHTGCTHDHHSHTHPIQSLPSNRKMSEDLLPHEESSPHIEKKRFHNINIEAAYIHILTDIILSVGVILSAGIIYFLAPEGHVWSYWQLADPLCTYLFSFMAIYSTLPIIKESLLFLLDACSDPKLLPAIQRALAHHPAVERVEMLKLWSTNRGKHYGGLRVRVKKGAEGLDEIKRVFTSRGVEGFVQLLQSEDTESVEV